MYFNSNMVRLKEWAGRSKYRHSAWFQFQYGSIKRKERIAKLRITANFNSNMVRLKARYHDPILLLLWFQFQYGSIKSIILQAVFIFIYPFQFQYGSIKRKRICFSGAILLYFNSNMVRLKGKLKPQPNETLPISIPIWFD